jgi:hypothetical protein
VHGAVPFWVAAPVMAIETVALSPAAVPQLPPSDVTEVFVLYGNVRGVPLTEVKLTAGAAVSMTTVRGALTPVLPSMSVWLAFTV